jgi:hypothetical protein
LKIYPNIPNHQHQLTIWHHGDSIEFELLDRSPICSESNKASPSDREIKCPIDLYNLSMAKLSNETLTTTFYLLRQLAEEIEQSCATEWIFFEQYGETPSTIDELEEFQNIRERLNRAYSRLNTLLLRILEAQPTAANAMLELLAQAIDDGQANLEAANASIREIKQGWNLP